MACCHIPCEYEVHFVIAIIFCTGEVKMVLFPLVSAECTVPESQLLCVSISSKEFGHQVKPAFKYEFNLDELHALHARGNFVCKLVSTTIALQFQFTR